MHIVFNVAPDVYSPISLYGYNTVWDTLHLMCYMYQQITCTRYWNTGLSCSISYKY